MSIQNYSQSPSLYLSGTRWSMLKKVNSCTYMFSLTFLTLCFCFHHLPTFSYHSRLWVSRRGHSKGETCGYNRPAGILIQSVQHLICATCSHVSIYIYILYVYINMYANPMLIFALCQFMIKYFASILFWNYNLINRKSAIELEVQKSQAA